MPVAMSILVRLLMGVVVAGLVSGCEVRYKRGAGGDALAEDSAACRAETGAVAGEAAFEACMEGKGWTTAREGAVLEPGEAEGPELKAMESGVEVTTARAHAVETLQPAAMPTNRVAPATDTVPPVPSAGLPAGPIATPPPAQRSSAAGASGSTAKVAMAPVEPATRNEPPNAPGPRSVASWWKVGGSPDQLRYDQHACRNRTPSERGIAWQADSAFLRCMREKGWYAINE